MKTRVTITLDPAVHRQARQTAAARRTTVSGLITTLLESAGEHPSVVDEMRGCASLRTPPPGSDPLHAALTKRYISAR